MSSRFNLISLVLVLTVASAAVTVQAPGAHAQSRSSVDGAAAGAPTPASPAEDEEVRPFGEKLFEGGFQGEREDGLNPDYLVRPGDHITLRIWGATNFADVLVVDAQGNVFLPDVGPIRVVGIRNGDLAGRITDAVHSIFTQNVSVYTNLEGTSPVLVYVTGYVNAPGSFAGVSSDSLLYYLSRAGGIDPGQGSYRNVVIRRGNEVLEEVDLYDFLLDGALARLQFVDGDTIVVRPRGATVTTTGSVRNEYQFEIPREGVPGRHVTNLARPTAGVSHVSIRGYRTERPFTAYLPLSEFLLHPVQDGDQVEFHIDQPQHMMMVSVDESHLGPSRYAVARGTTLLQLLDNVEVDPDLADTGSVFIKRRSVMRRQKQALGESLTRLETTVLGATSQTDSESAIRVQEADLISRFVERARQVEPEGILVVMQDGESVDLRLQPEDVVIIPERSRVVLVSGEVMAPQALVYIPGERIEDYVAKVGGYTERADKTGFLLRRRNGEVMRGELTGNLNRGQVREGDEIVIFPEVPVKNLQVAATITEVLFRLAAITATVIRLN